MSSAVTTAQTKAEPLDTKQRTARITNESTRPRVVLSKPASCESAGAFSRRRFMKCHRCPKVATLHITELVKGEAHELHLCEECAHTYLQNPDVGESVETGAGGLIKPPSGIGEAELE